MLSPSLGLLLIFVAGARAQPPGGGGPPPAGPPPAGAPSTPVAASPTASPGTSTACSASAYTGDARCNLWRLNTDQVGAVMNDYLYDVQAVAVHTTGGGTDYLVVEATGMPSYSRTLTAADMTKLASRPRASDDFVTAGLDASLGDVVE